MKRSVGRKTFQDSVRKLPLNVHFVECLATRHLDIKLREQACEGRRGGGGDQRGEIKASCQDSKHKVKIEWLEI